MRALIEDWLRDLRLATRTLRRSPGLTIIAVGTLGLAIGATAGIFGVVKTVLLDPLPYPDADRLVYVASSAPGSDLPDEFPSAVEFFVHYGEQSELLEGIATFNSFTNTLRAGDRIERPRMSAPTASLFSTLGVDPILGRLPTSEDESGVVVISHDRWFLDRIATHILAFEGDSQVEWFEGNYQEYAADFKRRKGVDADRPHRIKYRKLTR